MSQLKRLRELLLQEKLIKKEISSIKDDCMNRYLNDEYFPLEDECVKLTIVPESKTTTIDLRAVQKNESKLYEDLLDVYPKETVRKAYVRTTLK